jgi:hypothetical protein
MTIEPIIRCLLDISFSMPVFKSISKVKFLNGFMVLSNLSQSVQCLNKFWMHLQAPKSSQVCCVKFPCQRDIYVTVSLLIYLWPQKVSGHAILGRCGWQTNVWITWQHLNINTPCNSKNHSYIYVDHVYKRNSALIMAQWSSIWKYKNWACLLVCSVSEEQVTSGICFIDWYESIQHY